MLACSLSTCRCWDGRLPGDMLRLLPVVGFNLQGSSDGRMRSHTSHRIPKRGAVIGYANNMLSYAKTQAKISRACKNYNTSQADTTFDLMLQQLI